MEKTKTIGKIILDERFYEGTDRYSDGDIENVLLEIAEKTPADELRKVTEESLNWPVLYHFSPFRENIAEWIPLPEKAKVLEVGAGCGAITGCLSKKAGSVTCIDLSERRSMINANRLKESDNVTIMVGNFKDVETALDNDYDAIFLIGVFEYANGYMETSNPYKDFLDILLKHLKQGGRMFIAIENRMGLKYFAGCREDHTGGFFDGLEGYPKGGVARTFTRDRLEKIFKESGIEEYSFYYPYPDYKFTHTLFSDEILPKKGELHDNIRNFDRNRMILMDEGKVFDTILEDGTFPLFSNSYMAVIGPELSEKYIKYSTDRDEKHGICTTIVRDGEKMYVTKRAASGSATEHIKNVEKAYQSLCRRYEGSSLKINRMERLDEKTLKFEYVNGVTLEELLDEALFANDRYEFLSLIDEYKDYVNYNSEDAVTDYDLIFQNIIVSDETWTVIDYEWTYPEVIPPQEIIKRAFWCYVQGNPARKTALKWCDIDENFEEVVEKEKEFQKRVQGTHPALSEIRHRMGKAAFSLDYMLRECGCAMDPIQIYEDHGSGFSEEKSYHVGEIKQLGKEVTFTITISKTVKKLRIDPGNQPTFVVLKRAELNGENILAAVMKKEAFSRDTNGKKLGEDGYMFTTPDPHFAFKVPAFEGDTAKLTITMILSEIPAEIAGRL
ncbi:MAG: class I SAM-dependent methyltransferase [Lachnospiraceae bacterium]|nr:class I SAM-dependent methyltransferase [Lachnospiraceae bacterium]